MPRAMVSVARTAGVDVNTQQSFEALNARAVAVVVDPIQSVKGKVGLGRPCRPQHTRPILTANALCSLRLTPGMRRAARRRDVMRGVAGRW